MIFYIYPNLYSMIELKNVTKCYKKNENNNTLVLFKSVEKGFWLDIQERLQGKVENLFVVHGKVKLSDRLEAIKVSETKNNCIILASFSTFSTGINLKNLHNVIFTESYKSLVKIGQSIGRGMRVESVDGSRQRIDFIDTDKKADISQNAKTLETLFVISTNKEAINSIVSWQEEQNKGIDWHEVSLEKNEVNDKTLFIPTYKLHKISANKINNKNN